MANVNSNELSKTLDDINVMFPVVARKIVVASRVKTKTGFSEMSSWILHGLGDGELKPSEISRIFSISKPNVTTLINGLVEGGYVQRSHDDKDRRVIRISITEKGRKLILKRRRIVKKFILNKVAKLNNDEVMDLTNKLGDFYKVLLKIENIL